MGDVVSHISGITTEDTSCAMVFFFKNFTYLFLERGEGREKEEEKHR